MEVLTLVTFFNSSLHFILTIWKVTILCGWCCFFLVGEFPMAGVAPPWGQLVYLTQRGQSPPTKVGHQL